MLSLRSLSLSHNLKLDPPHPPSQQTLRFNLIISASSSSSTSLAREADDSDMIKKLAKKVKAGGGDHECLLKEHEGGIPHNRTPTGFFALHIGEERQRHVVPTSYLSHPLFKMLLDKAYNEYGFDQKNGLLVPCSVSTFRQVLNAIECSNGRFDLAKIFDDIP